MDLVTREDEDLLLDLLNTAPVAGGVVVDELADLGSGRGWARAHGGAGTAAEVAELRAVRDAIAGAVRGDTDERALAAQVERIALRPSLSDGVVRWQLQAPEAERLSARALLAWAVLSERAPGRLRPCANADCRLFLIDRSNANTARWCSMATCGNRFKARRHYQRSRGVAGE